MVQCCAPLGAPSLSEEQVDELERVFKALADRHRVKILNRLLAARGEAVCVCEFEELLGLKQSTVSYHLKQLLDAGIVERERRGTFAYFTLPTERSSTCATCSRPRRRRNAGPLSVRRSAAARRPRTRGTAR